MNQDERRLYLIEELLKEDGAYAKVPKDAEGQRKLLRGLMNVREAKLVSCEFLRVQDDYLKEAIRQKGITHVSDLTPVQEGLYIWQGDITTIDADAITNAANSGMTGCYMPNHNCIDNAIHTYAGVELRQECQRIMDAQGYPEPTGLAKITPAYNLPSKFIIHTVGPVVSGPLTNQHQAQLRQSYQSVLTLAAKHELESVALCCISTGVYGFPNQRAAEIAIEESQAFLARQTSVKKIIFNVFKDLDLMLYEDLLDV